MTTQLAIGYLAAGRRNPLRPGVSSPSVHVCEHDSISGRPAIPQAVIDWSDADLLDRSMPVGAGDPAAAIGGPPSFRVLADKRAKFLARVSVDAVMIGALAVMLIGLAGAVVKVGVEPNTAWAPRDPAALGAGRVPAVEVRGTRVDAVAEPVGPVAGELASTTKRSAAN
jgi:hypothetical protein